MPEPKRALEQLRELSARWHKASDESRSIVVNTIFEGCAREADQLAEALAREQNALICIKDVWTIAAKHIPAGMEDGCSCELCAAVNTECRSRENAMRREVIEECAKVCDALNEINCKGEKIDSPRDFGERVLTAAAKDIRALAAPTSAGDGPQTESLGYCDNQSGTCPAHKKTSVCKNWKSLAAPADAGKGGGE